MDLHTAVTDFGSALFIAEIIFAVIGARNVRRVAFAIVVRPEFDISLGEVSVADAIDVAEDVEVFDALLEGCSGGFHRHAELFRVLGEGVHGGGNELDGSIQLLQHDEVSHAGDVAGNAVTVVDDVVDPGLVDGTVTAFQVVFVDEFVVGFEGVEQFFPGRRFAETESAEHQTGFVGELAFVDMVPQIAEMFRFLDFVGGDDELRSLDFNFGGEKFLFGAGDFKVRDVVAADHLPAFHVIEVENEGLALLPAGFEFRRIRFDIGFAVVAVECEVSEPFADGFLIAGVDIPHVADVVDDGHAGVFFIVGEHLLRLLDFCERGGVVPIVVGSELDEIKFECGVAESVFPPVQEGLHLIAVEHAFAAVAFALIPDAAAHRVGNEGAEHFVVEHGRLLVVAVGQLFARKFRRNRGRFAFGESLLVAFQPGGIFGDHLFADLLVLFGAADFGVDAPGDVRNLGNRVEAFGGDPRFDAGAAPVSPENPDRHVELEGKFAAEEEGDRAGAFQVGAGFGDVPDHLFVIGWGFAPAFSAF